jgi:hypothetical protein
MLNSSSGDSSSNNITTVRGDEGRVVLGDSFAQLAVHQAHQGKDATAKARQTTAEQQQQLSTNVVYDSFAQLAVHGAHQRDDATANARQLTAAAAATTQRIS